MERMIAAKRLVFRFSDIEVHEHELRAMRGGQVLDLEPKAFRVLVYLIKNAGHLVTKSELIDAVWGETAVTDNSLTRVIALLRRVLEDDPRQPRFIETVTTVGYRWLCAVERMDDPSAVETVPTSTSAGESSEEKTSEATTAPIAGSRPRVSARTPWVWIGGLAAAVLLAGVFWYLTRPLAPPRVTAYTQLTFDGGEKDLVGTDGPRIYFGRENTMRRSVSAVPATGGASIEIPIALPNKVGLADVSPDGANLLVVTDAYGVSFPLRPQWIVGALDGVAQHPLPDGASAVFSPDAKSVVYSKPDGSICLVSSDGEGAHRIATVEGAWGFAWSPDGSRIRFSRDGHLWEITSNGSNLHQLLPEWHDSPWQCCGRWTTDGSLFVLLSQEKGSISPEIWALDERGGVFRRPRSTPIRLTTGPIRWTGSLPAKDPKTLYATGEVLRGELVRFDSRTQQFLPFLGMSAQGANFSPDGRFVIYVTFPDGFLFRANADGSNPVQLTDAKYAPFRPTWSPDGKQILFEDQRSDPHAIYLIPTSGGTAQRIILEDREPENDPTWSPDGKKIAFAVEPPEMPKYHIRIVDLSTHSVGDLPGSMGMYSPRWSSDGRFIAAMTHEGLNLKVFDTVTQTWTTLMENTFIAYPSWSRDSRWLYFETVQSTDKYSIRRVRFPGGKPEVVADLPSVNAAGWWGWFGLDATDTPIYMRDIGRHEIYALTLNLK